MTATLLQYTFGDSAVFLMSPWKPLMMWAIFMPWGWLVATKLTKDARFSNLNWKMWNSVHLACGSVALIVMVTAWSFWISWPLALIVLLSPILIYWKVRNDSLPEERRYYLTFGRDAEAALERRQAKARSAAAIKFTNDRGQDVPIPNKDDDLFPVYLQVEDIIGPALEARASMVELVVTDAGGVVAHTVDSIRTKQAEIETADGILAMNYLKGLAGLDIENNRRRQRGTFSLNTPDASADVHIMTFGSSKGQQVKLEFDREQRHQINYELLGLLPQQRAGLDELDQAHERHGLVLVSAPAGQGLTCTGYSLLGRHDAYTCNIKSLEHEIFAWVNGVDQVEWDSMNHEVDFATNLQSILRRDPDICLACDAADAESAKVAVSPGLNGPLIYYTLQGDSITASIREWVKLVGNVEDAVKPLRAVLNQRLLRKLCPNCRQPVSPEEQAQLNLPAGIPNGIHRPVGKVQVKNKVEDCPVCQGTGYLGLTAVFEVLIIDKDVRKHLRSGDLKGGLAQARRNRMLLMQEAALMKAGSGETSLEEINRVLQSKSSSGGASKKRKKSEVKNA